MNFIKVKYFCSTKDSHERMKTQTIDRDKILAKHISDKVIVSKIHKDPSKIKLNHKKYNSIKILKYGQKTETFY